jgi:hypothetical protein
LVVGLRGGAPVINGGRRGGRVMKFMVDKQCLEPVSFLKRPLQSGGMCMFGGRGGGEAHCSIMERGGVAFGCFCCQAVCPTLHCTKM